MQLDSVVNLFINDFVCVLQAYIRLVIRYVILCPHSRYPRVV